MGEPMQGIEAGAQSRANGAWAPINAASPPVDIDDRPRYNYGPNPYGVPYQQSPNQSSNAPSLISPSNGDSSGLNSPYSNPQGPPYHPLVQPQHGAAYPPVAQHPMPPPSATLSGFSNQQEYEKWIMDQENIRMNTGFDNFAQDMPIETWHEYSMQPNFLQAVHYAPQPLAGQTW